MAYPAVWYIGWFEVRPHWRFCLDGCNTSLWKRLLQRVSQACFQRLLIRIFWYLHKLLRGVFRLHWVHISVTVLQESPNKIYAIGGLQILTEVMQQEEKSTSCRKIVVAIVMNALIDKDELCLKFAISITTISWNCICNIIAYLTNFATSISMIPRTKTMKRLSNANLYKHKHNFAITRNANAIL